MIKKQIFRLLIIVGLLNTFTIIISAIIGPNSYVIASSLHKYFVILLCVIPILLTSIAFMWWLIDILLKTKERQNYFAIAFIGILADGVFIIGSMLFASGH